MRTDDEIISRIEALKEADFFGFSTDDLIVRLPFDKAKPYLTDKAMSDNWKIFPRDRDSLVAEMKAYMPFAWDKANNFRGLSAGRSMAHYASWVWLAGDDLGDLEKYDCYGKDNLVAICEHYGFDHAQWDDGVRANSEDEVA